MQPQHAQNPTQDPEHVRRLLLALGQWGAAEERGEPDQSLEAFAEQARAAYQSFAAAA